MAERGSTVVLSCSASGDPMPYYYWTKDGSSWFSDVEFKDSNKTLRLINVGSKNDGVYSCFATNDAGIDVTRSNVTVHGRFSSYHFLYNLLSLTKRLPNP